jgi:poly-gamma-glutamate capsule biosynthesis protein CapA/YwtB (metallophosphatase superfamily)
VDEFWLIANFSINTILNLHICNSVVVFNNTDDKYGGCCFLSLIMKHKSRLLFFAFVWSVNFSVFASDTSNQDTISITGVGDIMLGTNFPSRNYLPPNDGKDILLPVKKFLVNSDLTFGNLEGVLLTGKGNVKRCNDPSTCYAFKSPDHYGEYIKDAGFDVLSLANNHSGDFGAIGKKNTTRILKELDIHFAGLAEYPYTIFTKDSITYGLCAFAPNRGTMQINDYQKVRSTIEHLDSITNIVIVSFHGGGEGNKYKHITRKTETYLGENRGNPYEFARVAIDAGADIIFGHGPHLTRAIDIYKNRFIAYSLGNFATYGRFNLSGSKGVAPIITVYVNQKGEFINAKIVSTKQIGRGEPVPDNQNTALKEIMNLTKTDFPDSEMLIMEEFRLIPD